MFGENSIYEHLVFTKTGAAILDKARSKADYLVEKIKIRGDGRRNQHHNEFIASEKARAINE